MFYQENGSEEIKKQIASSKREAMRQLRDIHPRDIKKAKEVQILDLGVEGKGNFEPAIVLVNKSQLLLMFNKDKLDICRKDKDLFRNSVEKIREMLICDGYRKFYDVLLECYQHDFHVLFRCEITYD
ncbi:MAG: hypothetical protein FWE25_05865 [Lachnospiraceae bacterium]|nr:hypothetical protein [Lachnospiraceae bacterium]